VAVCFYALDTNDLLNFLPKVVTSFFLGGDFDIILAFPLANDNLLFFYYPVLATDFSEG